GTLAAIPLGARRAGQGERFQPAPRRLGVERAYQACARPAAIALEACPQGLGRSALALRQPRAVAGELAQLHVEVARSPEAAQHRLGAAAGAQQCRGELALEEAESRIDAP